MDPVEAAENVVRPGVDKEMLLDVRDVEPFALRRLEEGGRREPPLRGLSEDRAIAAGARELGLTEQDLIEPKQGGSVAFARCVTAYIAKRSGGISISRIARRFRLHDSSLARPLAVLEARIETEPALRTQIDRIVRELRSDDFTSAWTTEPKGMRKSKNQD